MGRWGPRVVGLMGGRQERLVQWRSRIRTLVMAMVSHQDRHRIWLVWIQRIRWTSWMDLRPPSPSPRWYSSSSHSTHLNGDQHLTPSKPSLSPRPTIEVSTRRARPTLSGAIRQGWMASITWSGFWSTQNRGMSRWCRPKRKNLLKPRLMKSILRWNIRRKR